MMRLLRVASTLLGLTALLAETVGSFAFAPDGTIRAAAHGEGAVRLWDTVTGELRGRLEGVAGFTSELAFAPDGKSLAATADNGTTRISGPDTPAWPTGIQSPARRRIDTIHRPPDPAEPATLDGQTDRPLATLGRRADVGCSRHRSVSPSYPRRAALRVASRDLDELKWRISRSNMALSSVAIAVDGEGDGTGGGVGWQASEGLG